MRKQWLLLCLVIGITVASGVGLALAATTDMTHQGPASPDQKWQIGFTPSYSSGNFGTNTTSTFFYAPTSIRRFFRDGDVAIVIPFVMATTDGQTTIVGGSPTPVQSNTNNSGPGNNNTSTGCTNQGPGNNNCPTVLTGQVAGNTTTNAGLGDIILRGRYYIVEEKGWVPLIAITGRLKLPTADASRGLGTGKMDEGVGSEISKRLGDSWITFLDGGFNVIGRPDGLNLRNQWWYDVGGGYYIMKNLLGTVYFEEYRSLVSGVQNIRDVFFGMNYRASSEWRFNGGVSVGLSNGAPDYALSIGTSYRF
ncbi:MAG: transporter [Nitrospira sp.]